ncbi:MAG: hypothetical protein KC912_15735 [Proteobacteria bacterium]|nr:hypothetical protein [Pseudomonadota bacterium]
MLTACEAEPEWRQTTNICLSLDAPDDPCPTPEEAMADPYLFVNGECSSEIRAITGPGVVTEAGPDESTACCYPGEARNLMPECGY